MVSTFWIELPVGARCIQLLVRRPGFATLVYLDGTAIGAATFEDDGGNVSLGASAREKAIAVGIDPDALVEAIRERVSIESRAREVLARAQELATEGRERSLAFMLEAARELARRESDLRESERERSASVRERIEQLALRFR